MNYLFDKDTGEKVPNVYEKDGQIVRIDYEYFDSVISTTETSGVEVLKFAKPFRVPKHVALDADMVSDYVTNFEFAEAISAQRWKSVGGTLIPADPSVKIADLIASRKRAARESKSRFYNYALGENNWQYFCTWTFSDPRCRSDKDLLYATYKEFMVMLRKSNPDVKAIATYEEFEKGGYHMHALLGNCLLRLTPAINPHTGEFVYSEFGNQIFNCIDWKAGFSTVCCIVPGSSKQQVVNYLGKYLTKQCSAPYRCKRFFHTLNLDCRDCYLFNTQNVNEPVVRFLQNVKGELSDGSFPDIMDEIVEAFDLEQVKHSDTMTVYRSKVDMSGYLDHYPEVFHKKI